MSPRALGVVETQTVEAPTLVTLAERIGALHREIQAQPGRYAEMNTLLTQAQKDAGPGGWLRWLSDNKKVLGFGERQARAYLREPEARASDQARHAESEKKRRAAAKPKLTEAERLALKAGTAALNPLTGKVISLVHTCGVPGCGQSAFTTSTICDHLLCETHGADISCSINQAQVCPACASDKGSTTEVSPAPPDLVRDDEDGVEPEDSMSASEVTYQPVEETAENKERRRSEFKKERAGERAKMLLLINTGYKQLAPKFHPDTGGTTEAMIVLCRARDLLTRYAEKWS